MNQHATYPGRSHLVQVQSYCLHNRYTHKPDQLPYMDHHTKVVSNSKTTASMKLKSNCATQLCIKKFSWCLPGNHNSVVSTKPCWRTDQATVVACTHALNASTKKIIACHTTRQYLWQSCTLLINSMDHQRIHDHNITTINKIPQNCNRNILDGLQICDSIYLLLMYRALYS